MGPDNSDEDSLLNDSDGSEESDTDDDQKALARRVPKWGKMNIYDKTIQSLELKFIPTVLPCRDK